MISNIKTILGIKDNKKDELLNCLVDLSKAEFKAITHRSFVDDACISQMVIYRYSLLGTEGLNGESYNGQSFSYQVDYPDNLRKQILSFRKIRLVGSNDNT